MTPHLTVARRCATILLDEPGRRNALGPDDLAELVRIAAAIDADETIGVALVRATGETFCAGYDLSALRAELESGAATSAQSDFARAVDAIENLRVPTICAIDGGAFGGGTDVALACDLRIGTNRASLAVPAARFGLQFYYGGLRRYVERLGVDTAKRVFLLAETIEASDLLRIGFLHELIAEERLDARIEAMTARILANSSDATRGLKRSLNDIARGTAYAEVIDEAFAASLRSSDTVERLTATRKRSQ